MNGDCHILLRSDSKKKRAAFRKSCREQNMTMTKAMNILMDEVIDGNIRFRQGAEKVK